MKKLLHVFLNVDSNKKIVIVHMLITLVISIVYSTEIPHLKLLCPSLSQKASCNLLVLLLIFFYLLASVFHVNSDLSQ